MSSSCWLTLLAQLFDFVNLSGFLLHLKNKFYEGNAAMYLEGMYYKLCLIGVVHPLT